LETDVEATRRVVLAIIRDKLTHSPEFVQRKCRKTWTVTIKLNGEVVNLNPVATTGPGTADTYAANSATCVSASGCAKGTIRQGTVILCTRGCEPRGLGVNPVIQNLWNTTCPYRTAAPTATG